MKNNKRKFWLFAGALCLTALASAMVVRYNAYLVNEAGLTYNKTYPLPLDSTAIDSLSVTSLVSSVTFSSQNFTDGQKSTGTITVTQNSGLAAVAATDSLTVLSTQTIPSTAVITVNGVPLYVNVHWFFDVNYTTITAASIKNGVNTYVAGVTASTASSSVVTLTAKQTGSFGNNMTLTSSVSTITATTAHFTGGKDQATISINGILVPFTPVATSSGNAKAISDGIMATTALTSIISSSWTTAGVVFATSTAVGSSTNYMIASSTQSALTIGGSTVTVQGLNGAGVGQMWGGSDSAYTLSSKQITIASHGFTSALPVLYSTSSGQAISGLTNQTTYYVIVVNSNVISLASSSANAQSGTGIVLASTQAKTTADSFRLAPLAISGTPSFGWQVSNDGVNWTNYTTTSNNVTISSVTVTSYTAAGASNAWDFGYCGYAFIRLSVIAPTQGAISLKVAANGKNSGAQAP